MKQESIQDMMHRNPEEFYFYDTEQKGFNQSINQKDWYGFEKTRTFMEMISVNEGLTGYQATKWRNHSYQQQDLKLINDLMVSQTQRLIQYLNDSSRWSVFWDKTVKPTLEEN